MACPTKSERKSPWLTKSEMAAAFDVSESYFDRSIRPLVQAEHVRHENGRLFFYVRGVIEAWANRRHQRKPNDKPPSLKTLLRQHRLGYAE